MGFWRRRVALLLLAAAWVAGGCDALGTVIPTATGSPEAKAMRTASPPVALAKVGAEGPRPLPTPTAPSLLVPTAEPPVGTPLAGLTNPPTVTTTTSAPQTLPSPTPRPFVSVAPALPVWPESRRTGDPAADRVLEAVLSGDAAVIESVVEYFSWPCVAFVLVAARPPFCRPGEALDTPGRFFLTSGHEAQWYRAGEPLPAELFASLAGSGLRLVAAHDRPGDFPGARLVLVLVATMRYADSGTGFDCIGVTLLLVGDSGLTGITGDCSTRARLLPEGARYLVPPLPEPPR